MFAKQKFILALPIFLASSAMLVAGHQDKALQKNFGPNARKHTPLLQDAGMGIACYYLFSEGTPQTYNPNDTVKFPAPTPPIVGAQGGISYNQTTGQFTAKQGGTFVISYEVGAVRSPKQNVVFGIVVNKSIVMGSEIWLNSDTSSSGSIIVSLRKGDTIELSNLSVSPIIVNLPSSVDRGNLASILIQQIQ